MARFWRKYGDIGLLFFALQISSTITIYVDAMFAESPGNRIVALVLGWSFLTAVFIRAIRSARDGTDIGPEQG